MLSKIWNIAVVAALASAVKAGTISTAINKTSTQYDKYSELKVRDTILKPREPKTSTYGSTWSEVLFGKQEHFRLGQNHSKNLSSIDDTIWTGAVYMGTKAKRLEVIFDNASDWLIVEGSECSNCEENTYDISTSTAAKQVG